MVAFKIATIASEWLPAPRPTKRTQDVARKTFEQNVSVVGIDCLNQLRAFMLLQIAESVFRQKTIAVLKAYLLLDIYMGRVDVNGNTKSVYDYAQSTIALVHIPNQVRNKIEWNLLSQMVDYYKKDRRVLVVVAGTKDQAVVGETRQIAAMNNVDTLFIQ